MHIILYFSRDDLNKEKFKLKLKVKLVSCLQPSQSCSQQPFEHEHWGSLKNTFWTVWTHADRCWGLWRLSRDVGSKTVDTVHSCVQPCCVDSRHRRLRWHFLKPRTRPCQSDTSPSAGYSCTLKTPQKKKVSQSTDQQNSVNLICYPFYLQHLLYEFWLN